MERRIAYELDGVRYEGALVFDESVQAPRPGILSLSDWKGICPETIAQARLIAGTDYVVFMADLYGAGYGARKKTQDELMQTFNAIRGNYAFTVAAGAKGMEMLLAEGSRSGLVDASKIGLVGYCAGGGFGLEYARTGARVDAIVLFHVTAPNPLDPGRPSGIKGRVLVLHGSADPVTPQSSIRGLEEELDRTGVPWQTVMWSGAVHSFTDVTAKAPGYALYDPVLDRRANALAQEFLAETLRPTPA